MENTKDAVMTHSKCPNLNTLKLFSHKYKVLSQNKSWDSIPSLGLHLIQNKFFLLSTTLHKPLKEIFPYYILPHHRLTQSKITTLTNKKLHIYIYAQALLCIHARKSCFDVDVVPNLDNGPKSQTNLILESHPYQQFQYSIVK